MAHIRRYFEDVTGDEALPTFQIIITRTHIVKYVGAGGDFFPIHHDEAFATSIGMPSIVANGLMHGGMLSRCVTDWVGDGCVKRFKLRFASMVWPGDTLTFAGRVVRKFQEGGEHLVECALSVVNQNGEKAITGEATVALPTRA